MFTTKVHTVRRVVLPH